MAVALGKAISRTIYNTYLLVDDSQESTGHKAESIRVEVLGTD